MKQLFIRTSILGGVFGLALLSHSPARAQGGMPDLSDFAGAIAKSAQGAPPKIVSRPGELFKSGLAVPRVKPGEGARAIGRDLRLKTEAAAAAQPEMSQMIPALLELEKSMPAMLTNMEKEFSKHGLAPRDMGTAYAFAFLSLHENATGKTTTDAQDKVASRTLSTAIAKAWGAKWKTLAPAAQEKIYESLVMATTLNVLLTQQFDAAGKTEDAAVLRQGSADLFVTLVGVPPAQVVIAADGRISGLSAK